MQLRFRLIKGKQSRRLEISDDVTMSAFDLEIRKKWKYDTWDHCSSFYGQGWFGPKELVSIYPDGSGKNQKQRIRDLNLSPGDELGYVYDYGEWRESKIIFQKYL